MKVNKFFTKSTISVLLIVATITSFTACASTSEAKSANQDKITEQVTTKLATEEKESFQTTSDDNSVDNSVVDNSLTGEIEENHENVKSQDDLFIDSLEGLSFTFTASPKITNVKRAFSSNYTFIAKDKDGNPLANYPVTISYPDGKEDGELTYKEIDVLTDQNGSYTYEPAVPTFSANTTLAVYPTPINNSDKVFDAAINHRAEADWKVRSDIITKGAVLFIWDFNEKGKAINNSYEILSEFRTRGMTMVGNAPVNETSYIGKPLSTLYKENYEIIENSYGYLIVGTVKFTKPVEATDDGQYLCSLVAEIQAVTMKDGNQIFSSTFTHEAKGKNWNTCVTKAKSELAEEIVDALVYGL